MFLNAFYMFSKINLLETVWSINKVGWKKIEQNPSTFRNDLDIKFAYCSEILSCVFSSVGFLFPTDERQEERKRIENEQINKQKQGKNRRPTRRIMRKSVEQYCDTAAIKKTISYRMNFNRVSFDRVFKAITHFHKSCNANYRSNRTNGYIQVFTIRKI